MFSNKWFWIVLVIVLFAVIPATMIALGGTIIDGLKNIVHALHQAGVH